MDDGEPLEDLIGFELRRAYVWSSRLFSELLSGAAIKPGQYSLLFTIERHPGQTLGFIAERLALDPANLAPLLNELERLGYVERVVQENDRRARAIRLQPRGREVLEQAHAAIAQHEARLTRGLDAAARRQFLKLLRQIAANAREPA
ncbi:MAG TPA: MarR family transcriptional regulator [Caulobacteraceae bacterium]|jgi:DNA-binding MarR family transcriptional regulator